MFQNISKDIIYIYYSKQLGLSYIATWNFFYNLFIDAKTYL